MKILIAAESEISISARRSAFSSSISGRYDADVAIVALSTLGFVDKYSLYTKRFEDYVSLLCAKMTLTDAALVAEIDWKAAKRIDKKYLSQLVTGPESGKFK